VGGFLVKESGLLSSKLVSALELQTTSLRMCFVIRVRPTS